MSTTIAQLNDRVYLELGELAAEFCDLDKIHNAVVQHNSILTAHSRESSINVLLGVTPSFTPTTTEYNITSLIGKGIPAWIEKQDDDDVWRPMRVVPLVQLADYTAMGMLAAAFYAEDSATGSTDPVQYVAFSFVPSTAVRIRFDRDTVKKNLTENTELPDHVAELMVKRVQNSVIPRIKAQIVLKSRNDAELRKLSKDLRDTLSEIHAQNEMDMKPLQALWKIWAFKDRGNESSFNKPTPSGRTAYGPRSLY